MNLIRISRKLSYLLRHSSNPKYISNDGAWADTNTIVSVLKRRYPEVTLDTIKTIVAEDEKGRYSFNEDGSKIRANQGHSVLGVVIEMQRADPPDILYHGTATRFLNSIMRDGLVPMHRHFVHISPDYETAVKVGSRHGNPVVLVINAKQFVADGNELYVSSNGVWQAKSVPTKYFTVIYEKNQYQDNH